DSDGFSGVRFCQAWQHPAGVLHCRHRGLMRRGCRRILSRCAYREDLGSIIKATRVIVATIKLRHYPPPDAQQPPARSWSLRLSRGFGSATIEIQTETPSCCAQAMLA